MLEDHGPPQESCESWRSAESPGAQLNSREMPLPRRKQGTRKRSGLRGADVGCAAGDEGDVQRVISKLRAYQSTEPEISTLAADTGSHSLSPNSRFTGGITEFATL